MAVRVDLGHAWQCDCGKWNNFDNVSCWKCKAHKQARSTAPIVEPADPSSGHE